MVLTVEAFVCTLSGEGAASGFFCFVVDAGARLVLVSKWLRTPREAGFGGGATRGFLWLPDG